MQTWSLQLLLLSLCGDINDLKELHWPQIPKRCAWSTPLVRRTSSFSNSRFPFLLSHHEKSGPSGKQQSAEQHRVAEENKFEDFPECTEAADEKWIQIHRVLLRLLPATRLSQVSHVLTSTHSANIRWNLKQNTKALNRTISHNLDNLHIILIFPSLYVFKFVTVLSLEVHSDLFPALYKLRRLNCHNTTVNNLSVNCTKWIQYWSALYTHKQHRLLGHVPQCFKLLILLGEMLNALIHVVAEVVSLWAAEVLTKLP